MARIIKAGGEVGPERGVQAVAFHFDDMASQANHCLNAAQRRAQDIVARAEREAGRIRARAQQEGRQTAAQVAQEAAQAEWKRQLETTLPALDEAIRSIQRAKQSWLNHWEKNVVGLAAAIAARVIRRQLTQTPEITLQLVREALELAAGGGRLQLRLNPADYDSLGSHAKQLAARLDTLAPAEVIPDPEISPGGCRVDTEFGAVDQQIEAQLARIEEELT